MRQSTTLYLSLALLACSSSEPRPPEPHLQIQVAPLSLTGVGDACYTIWATSGLGDEVFRVTNICADGYGDGKSAITYIAPCDASAGAAEHVVSLTLDALFDTSGAPITDLRNPTRPDADTVTPLMLPATCRPNGDTPVDFNLVVMRSAGQGFFDIAVESTTSSARPSSTAAPSSSCRRRAAGACRRRCSPSRARRALALTPTSTSPSP